MSNEDFIEFLNIIEDVLFILAEGSEQNKRQIIETLEDMEAILSKSNTLMAKAA